MSLWPDLANATKGRSADELLIVARDGHSPLHASFFGKAYLKARAAIDRPTMRIHDLRKTAATLAAHQAPRCESSWRCSDTRLQRSR